MTEPSRPSATTVLPVAWCLTSAALFGASTPASKWLLGGIHPVLLSGLLYLGAALAVSPGALLRGAELHRIDRRNWQLLLGAIVFGGVIGPVLLLVGLSMASAGTVALWLNLEGVATALLARAFFKEHIHATTWLAIGLIVIASTLLSGATPRGEVAVLFVALACVAWGLDNNLTSMIDRFTPSQVTLAKGICAGVSNTCLGLMLADGVPSLELVGFALAVGALGYGVSLLLYVAGAQQLGAIRSQLLFSTAPAFGLVLAWSALGEPVSALQIAAVAMMAAAVWLWHRERHGHLHVHGYLQHTHLHRHDDGHHEHEHAAVSVVSGAWHSHEHEHADTQHAHPHHPDLHHRHRH